ncbi:NUMOD4 domain-containing protein [Streptomyces althioticus]|uniref:NUMOD4 domain-containing protein n=1 Tax=Streptomyces althioticus TaxID=83380 RepID=UPI0033E4BD62
MEEWRSIPGFGGYEASDRGRIRSWRKAGPGVGYRSNHPKVLKPKVDRYGYFALSLSREGVRVSCTVHRLVYLAFKGLIPDGLVIRHLDGDQTHNVPGNLSLGTVKDNKADSIKHGTHAKGETSGLAKLSDAQVREIRRLWATGDYTQTEIGKRFGVVQQLVSQIVHRQAWAHLD